MTRNEVIEYLRDTKGFSIFDDAHPDSTAMARRLDTSGRIESGELHTLFIQSKWVHETRSNRNEITYRISRIRFSGEPSISYETQLKDIPLSVITPEFLNAIIPSQ